MYDHARGEKDESTKVPKKETFGDNSSGSCVAKKSRSHVSLRHWHRSRHEFIVEFSRPL